MFEQRIGELATIWPDPSQLTPTRVYNISTYRKCDEQIALCRRPAWAVVARPHGNERRLPTWYTNSHPIMVIQWQVSEFSPLENF